MNSIKTNGVKIVAVGAGYVAGNMLSDAIFTNVLKAPVEGAEVGKYDAYMPEVGTIALGIGTMVYAKNEHFKLFGMGIAVSGLMSSFKVWTVKDGNNYAKYAVV